MKKKERKKNNKTKKKQRKSEKCHFEMYTSFHKSIFVYSVTIVHSSCHYFVT